MLKSAPTTPRGDSFLLGVKLAPGGEDPQLAPRLHPRYSRVECIHPYMCSYVHIHICTYVHTYVHMRDGLNVHPWGLKL
jgi:hypothetical protein